LSTKITLAHDHDPISGVGFSLYEDWLDECAGSDVVNLRLSGVAFEAAADGNGATVTVTIPRAIAERLGLLKPKATGVPAADTLLHHHAADTADALEAMMEVLVGCVRPGPGCDDARDLAAAVERGEAALAAIGRLRVRDPDGVDEG